MKAHLSLILILCAVCWDCAMRCTSTDGNEGQGAEEQVNADLGMDTGDNSVKGQPVVPQNGALPAENSQGVQGGPVDTSSQNPNQNEEVEKVEAGMVEAPSEGAKQEIQVKSSLLKGYKGVKVTGTCGASFLVFFAPYLFIDVDTDSSNIYLGTDLIDLEVTEQMGKEGDEKNKCKDGKTFKFVAFIGDDHLTIKWKVYDSADQKPTQNDKAEMRKYVMKNLSGEFTSVQVHNVVQQNGSNVFESKNYALSNDMPEKCDAIAANCFLSGSVYIEKCYRCTLKMENANSSDVCYNYLPKVEKPTKEGAQIYDYYVKNSPDLEGNIHHKNVDGQMNGSANNGAGVVQGQETAEKEVADAVKEPAPLDNTGATEGKVDEPESTHVPPLPEQEEVAGVTDVDTTEGDQPEQVELPEQPEQQGPAGPEGQPSTSPEAAVLGTQLSHVLKYIKKNKVKMNLITYKNPEVISTGHDCSRSYSINPDKYEECVKICEANWSKCENDAVPGFCLYEHAKENDCFFCYV
uniref:Pco-TSERA2 protein n=1 Tax=Plasmodium coatneyi TaxID=208452 RepID=F1SZ04_9APIC|nr:Pco-TSERA2 [Plasmodium coatneyi]